MQPEHTSVRGARAFIRAITLACVLSFIGASMGYAAELALTSTAVLRAKYNDLAPQLENNAFGRPLVLESAESKGNLRGDVYAVLRHSYGTAQVALKEPSHWCDILILHLNTKYCRAVPSGSGTVLEVNIGRKSDQPIEKSYRVEFAWRVQEATPDHLAVVLEADNGPIGTRDYRILLEAVPLKNGQTFMHLAYSYSYGTAARLGLMAYLGTTGSKKVGFTVTGRRNNGQPVYIEGLRGLVERNTMRYYLAIEAYLGALSSPPAAQLDKRLNDWYAAAEHYPLQLHEIGQQEYLDMKRREYVRQQAAL
jgi:hypothetical protein